MLAPTTIRPVLFAAQRRLQSFAVAFIPPSRDAFHFHAEPGADDAAARNAISLTADTFLVECRDRTEPLLINRVRYQANGPLLGRFIIAPIHVATQLEGILLFFRACDAPQFDNDNLVQAAALGRQLSKIAAWPADTLTGLSARSAFEQLFELRSAEAPAAMLYGDIDRLHAINEFSGPEAGDRVIAAVAQALQSSLEAQDAALTRLSSDSFGVLLPACEEAQAQEIANRLRDAVAATALPVATDAANVTVSFGVAAVRAGERGFDHALAAAESACRRAKEQGRNRVEIYRDADTGSRRDEAAALNRLRVALTEGRFQVMGQPIASLLLPEETCRYEMLLRLLDDKGKPIPTERFMPAAIRHGLLPQLDRCVIGHVLARLKVAAAHPGFTPLQISLNLSGPSIGDPSFVDWLCNQLAQIGACDWLTFELTESAVSADPERTRQLMSRLEAYSCKFALDNFGAGASSIAQLRTLNFATLKIDGSFVRDILRNPSAQALVHAIAQMANAMGMVACAEYVETPEVCMRLIELQVQFGQGFAIGRPQPLTRILEPATALARAG
jgi:diguanylate cyclase (GGDEF)-like protein